MQYLIRLNHARYKPVGGVFKLACYHPYINGWVPCGINLPDSFDFGRYYFGDDSHGKKLCRNCRDVLRKPVVKCGKCKYWIRTLEEGQKAVDAEFGECRLNPPIYDRNLVDYTAAWPVTSPEDCCAQGLSHKLTGDGFKTQIELRAERDPEVVSPGDNPKPGFLASKLPGVVS